MSTRLSAAYAEAVCTLTLHPPEGKPPTLDPAVMDECDRVLSEIEARAAELSAVVLQSASPKFFCAGANINVLETINRDSIGPWVERGHRLMNRIESLPVPVIARVEGYALGGGLELAMACDLIFASSNAKFGQTETKLGFVTGWGGSFRLVRRAGLARAKELVFTGRIFDAEEAVRIGVAEWQGPPDALAHHLHEFLTAVAANSRGANREMKRLLESCTRATLAENSSLETAASQRCLGEGGDAAERLRNFLLKGRAKGSASTPLHRDDCPG
ncbi:MAG: enoyl-CoA hydratase/isomerase family protein [Opitutaceae bacterium]|nr:enoyl-CoA hydratase/isomerase family protein [Opitutaceae bacterium]